MANVTVFADKYGCKDYQASFKEYIEKKHIANDLFSEHKLNICHSKDETLIQLSDLIAGTSHKILKNCSASLKKEYISFSRKRILNSISWPPNHIDTPYDKDVTSTGYDKLIYKFSLKQANLYVIKHEERAEAEIQLRVAVVSYLEYRSTFVDEHEYTTTKELQSHLKDLGFAEIGKDSFRSKIIAPLRDSGVIISSSNLGYKIPCNFNDMEQFVKKVDSIVTPYIRRLGSARKELCIASNGEIDILKGPEHPHLVKFIDVMEEDRG